MRHSYETRGSLRKLLSKMEDNDPESSDCLPTLHPAGPKHGDQPSGKVSSSSDESSNKDSIASSAAFPKMSTPPSSIKSTGSSPCIPFGGPETAPGPSSSRDAYFDTILSPSESRIETRPSPSKVTLPLVAPSPDVAKETNQEPTSKAAGKRKRNDKSPSPSDDILGPLAHELDRSTRERLRLEAEALQDESGQVCPLQMAQLFMANSTLRAARWTELDEGERAIKRMRQDNLDLERLRERQEIEEAEKREKEEKRLANKRKYGLIRNKTPKTT
ncbi:hypothetical protein C2857_004307 [Epichloe festucae Fl1]|uniref:Uncharacterized protein n=1 Tax=Epichloe festucae (strain Fl1) TaxID=877507 RepID=A0A7S9KUZ7_EPIFF|nr:hypothetical protein C2857_004307 [Epichloe festucae Fl1]